MGCYEEAIRFFNMAKEYDNRSNIGEYIVVLYPMIVEANVKVFIREKKNMAAKAQKVQLDAIRKDAVLALRKARPWVNNHCLAYRSYGTYMTLTGQNKKAIGYYKKAIEIAKTLERKFDLGKGYYELAKLYENLHDNHNAELYYQGALRIFNELDAKKYINELSLKLKIQHEFNKSDIGTLPSWEKLILERKLKTLLETNKYTLAILNQNELFERILSSAVNLLGAEYGYLFLCEKVGTELQFVLKTSIHSAASKVNDNVSIKEERASRSIINRVVEEGKTLLFSDAVFDDSLKRSDSILATGVRSLLCSPILGRSGILGVIYLESSLLSGLFKDEDAGVLELISSQAGSSIETALLYQTLREYSAEIEQSRDKLKEWNQILEKNVAERTKELEILNGELQAYALKVEELSVVRERARIARDVHDTLGHTLIIIINLLSVASVTVGENSELTRQKLEQTILISKEGLKEVRRAVSGFSKKGMNNDSITEILNKYASMYDELGVKISISIDENLPYLNQHLSEVILKVCREGITNAMRHGKASEIYIILRYKDNYVVLFIYDNGKTKKHEISEGVGLRGMAERVDMVNGKIYYGFNGDDGFQIRMELPLQEPNIGVIA